MKTRPLFFFRTPNYNKDFKCETYWHELQWRAILRSLKLSPLRSPRNPLSFSLFSQRSEDGFIVCVCVGGGLFIIMTLLFTSTGDQCSPCTPGCQTLQNATGPCVPWQLLWLFNASSRKTYSWMYRHTSSSLYSELSTTAALTTQQLRQSFFDGYGLKMGREFLDVGNKSDRPHRMRPSLIFFTDFLLKGVCM